MAPLNKSAEHVVDEDTFYRGLANFDIQPYLSETEQPKKCRRQRPGLALYLELCEGIQPVRMKVLKVLLVTFSNYM